MFGPWVVVIVAGYLFCCLATRAASSLSIFIASFRDRIDKTATQKLGIKGKREIALIEKRNRSTDKAIINQFEPLGEIEDGIELFSLPVPPIHYPPISLLLGFVHGRLVEVIRVKIFNPSRNKGSACPIFSATGSSTLCSVHWFWIREGSIGVCIASCRIAD
ncbi:hypothetical protein Droror1_Dr00000355 [Drosera rotundifolia]